MKRVLGAGAAALLLLTACGPSTSSRGTGPGPLLPPSAAESDGAKTGAPNMSGGGNASDLPLVVPSTTCSKDVTMGGLPYGQGERVTPSLKVSWVLRCRVEQQTIKGSGVWNVVITERADGSPDALLAALAKPDEPTRTGIACPAIAMIVPWFMLVDTAGKPHLARIPTTMCGMPSPDVMTALNALPFRVTKTERTTLVQSELSATTGCPDQWKDVINLTISQPRETAPAPVPIDPGTVPKGTGSSSTSSGSTGSGSGGSSGSGGTPVEPVDPALPGVPGSARPVPPDTAVSNPAVSASAPNAGVGSASAGTAVAPPGVVSGTATAVSPPSPPAPRICVYRTDGEVGTLKSGRALGAGELTTILNGVGGALRPCSLKHTAFAVVFGSDQGDWTVELDGCTRALSPSGTFGQASSAALAVLRR